ncbi:MAG: glucose-1-phosphate thymidylyltransferase [Candidatus Bathyarchaeota archaeon]|nr:glucose-1-phosphate thymidylyltransferase [Candidatus Bathyarchaeota archaeon]
MKGVIIHGGLGTRLRPLTHTGPKQLIPVANKPISQYVLEDLKDSGVKDIAITLGHIYPEKVREHYGDGSGFGVNLTYIYQPEPRGIAQAVALCEEYVESQDFVVCLGDNLLKGGIKEYVEEFAGSNYDAMILLCEVKRPQLFGVARFDQNGRLVALVEKPKTPPSPYALTGIYFFRPVIFDMIRKLKPSWRGELEITEAIHLLVANGYSVGHHIVSGWWKDTGTPQDILEANRLVLDGLEAETKGTVESQSSVQGRVVLGSNSFIRSGALLRGPAVIGENSTIEGKVYIGPYTSIGNGVTVRRGEIENSIVMDGCLIDVAERITDSIIGPNTKITQGADSKPSGRRFVLGESSQVAL